MPKNTRSSYSTRCSRNHTFLLNGLNLLSSQFPNQGRIAVTHITTDQLLSQVLFCKTIERLINRRLLDLCDRNKLITNIQCGGRPKSSTIDHLIRLEHNIKKSFVLGEHFVSVFFDLEKAYDQTWRLGILRDMHSMGLRGLIPKFISEFLKHRTFKIKLQKSLIRILLLKIWAYPKAGVPQRLALRH